MKPNKNPLWQTNSIERKSYYSYFFGQNMIYSMLAAYLTTYLVFKEIDPVKSGMIVTIVKIWDAVNDAIFGVIFDKVKFKSGKKYIPWLKIACALTPAQIIIKMVSTTRSFCEKWAFIFCRQLYISSILLSAIYCNMDRGFFY